MHGILNFPFVAIAVCFMCIRSGFVMSMFSVIDSTVPPAPVLSETPTVTATTITITGSVPSGSVVTGFVVEWQRDTSVGCSDEDEDRVSVNGAFTSYTITGLEPGNRYTITVTVSNSAGSSGVSNTVTAMTEETGESD